MKTKIGFIAVLMIAVCLVTIAFNQIGSASSVEKTVVSENSFSQKVEMRCGWVSNPTPANWWLDDKDGEWTIGVQGGYQAEGDVPEFPDSKWVKTNVNYGYGCACLNVTVNRKERKIISIKSGTVKPLSVCRKDPKLKEPKE